MAEAVKTEGRGHMDPALAKEWTSNYIEPDVPGLVIRNLVFKAGPDYSGKYLHYNDPLIESL